MKVKAAALCSVSLAVALVFPATAAERSCPVGPTEADFALRKSSAESVVPQFTTMLATDAVVAMESESYELELWETDAPVDIKTPVHVSLAKGTLVGSRFFGGDAHRCVFFGLGAFEPPIDDEGRPFPTVCFEDRDLDGGSETLVFYAYKAQPGKGLLEAKIAPVQLKAHPHAIAPKPYVTFYRRLRVASVDGNRATFAIELGTTFASPNAPPEPTFQQASSKAVELHEGPVIIGGIDLNLVQVGSQWSATPTGQSQPWVSLDCGGSKVTLAN